MLATPSRTTPVGESYRKPPVSAESICLFFSGRSPALFGAGGAQPGYFFWANSYLLEIEIEKVIY